MIAINTIAYLAKSKGKMPGRVLTNGGNMSQEIISDAILCELPWV
jgi:hypothetical protein